MKIKTNMKRLASLALTLALVLALMATPALAADAPTATLVRTDTLGDTVKPGDTLKFETELEIPEGVTIDDYITYSLTIPAELTSAANATGKFDAPIEAPTSRELSFTAKVENTAAGAYTVSVKYDYTIDGEEKTLSASVTFYVLQDKISLTIATSPMQLAPGNSGLLSIAAKNTSSTDIPDVTLTLELPLVFTLGQTTMAVGNDKSKSVKWSGSSGSFSLNVGTIPTGKSASITANFLVNVLAPNGLYNPKVGVIYDTHTGKDTASGSIIVMRVTAPPTTPPTTPPPIIPSLPTPDKAPDKFTDDNGHWAETYINMLAAKGIVNGTGDTTFEPETGLTRAMIVQILYNVYGKGEIVSNSPFTDLTQDWYVNAINWAAKNEIVSGITDTEFAPNMPATREQTIVILARAATRLKIFIQPVRGLQKFTDDAQISEYASEAVYIFQRAGIVSGDENGNFYPTTPIKRGEFSKIMCFYLDASGNLGYDISSLK